MKYKTLQATPLLVSIFDGLAFLIHELYPMDIVVNEDDGRWRHCNASASGLTIMRSLYRPHGV